MKKVKLSIGLAIFIFLTGYGITSAENSFPFEILWDGHLPAEMDNGPRILDGPAGKYGHLVAKGDHLFFENGVSQRFWGVGLTFSSGKKTEFPPDKKIAGKIVRKLSQYGFNHVRFVGLDGSAPEVIDTWLKTGKVDCPTLDKLDYFISLLRTEGIYYSFSINNNAALTLSGLSEVPEKGFGTFYQRYKHVRLIDNSAITMQIEWYRAFFSHINPYTGLSYANDPANLYVSAVNEDSASIAYYNYYERLGENAKRLLNERYRQFIESKIGDVGQSKSPKAFKNPIYLPSPAQLRKASKGEKRLVAEFLYETDSFFAEKIKECLQEVGFKGLFTFNNNWAGYSALLVDYRIGDYIEMHSYFDHPKRLGKFDKVSGRSLITDLYPSDFKNSKMALDFGNPFNRLFLSLVDDRPLFITEWNHNAWSERPYEGQLLMAAYAAFQGIELLDCFTFFVHPNPDPKGQVPSEAFAVGPNPVWMALNPSLSIAFVKGYLSEGVDECTWIEAPSQDIFFERAANIGMRNRHMNSGIPLDAGYWYKLRKTLISPDSADPCILSKRGSERVQTKSGEIIWSRMTNGRANLKLTSSHFVAVAGDPSPTTFDLGMVKIKLEDQGVVTVVALDDQPISKSKNILVTSVSGFENSGWNRRKTAGYYMVSQPGHAPVKLKIPRAKVIISQDNSWEAKAFAVNFTELVEIKRSLKRSTNNPAEIILQIGNQQSPWYLITN